MCSLEKCAQPQSLQSILVCVWLSCASWQGISISACGIALALGSVLEQQHEAAALAAGTTSIRAHSNIVANVRKEAM